MGYNNLMESYPIPAKEARVELSVVNSRFIASAAPVFSVEEAKDFITRIKAEYPDASHNVPAYVIGYGASTISHCNDDGEPSGTAGRPALAVLSGSGLGDVAIVVTRYFGGTKLGKGGLVRAYSDSVRAVLEILPRARKIPTHTVMLVIPYSWVERLRRLVEQNGGQVEDEEFAVDVTVTARFPTTAFPAFQEALTQASHGSLLAEIIDTQTAIVPISQGE
jgi:uncharacterized YigZ family protein